ncbi:MAG: NAD(P)/FAD-dependent oxidoreductase [Flavobacteriales bacterium]
MNIPSTDAQRVVIIGGGFGGLQLAKKLRNKNFQVVLLDKHNYHAFQPLFYQVATAGLEPGSIAYPFRKIFNSYLNYFFRMAEVKRIDYLNKKVETNIGQIDFDYLVIATGATTNFFGMKNIEKLAMPMKTVAEALDIRSLMLQNLEEALLTNDVTDKDSLMGIVIVGGGPTGVELAGALAELKKDILPKDYPDLDMRVMDIHLIDSNARILKEFSEESSTKAHRTLTEMGVDIRLNERVIDYDGKTIFCKSEEQLPASMVIWAAGVKANIPPGLPLEITSSGRIAVNAFNQVIGMTHVFAIGDVAAMMDENNPRGHAMVAQPAMQQGLLLSKNLVHLRNGEELTPFEYKNLGSMATIGRNKAVTEFARFKMFGWFAWVAWLLVHVYQLVGFRNKIVVLLSWAQNYIRHARDLRLIIRPFKRT